MDYLLNGEKLTEKFNCEFGHKQNEPHKKGKGS